MRPVRHVILLNDVPDRITPTHLAAKRGRNAATPPRPEPEAALAAADVASYFAIR